MSVSRGWNTISVSSSRKNKIEYEANKMENEVQNGPPQQTNTEAGR